MSERIEPGDAMRFYCGACETECEITLEPKVSEGASAEGLSAKHVIHCPFCGEDGKQFGVT